MGSEAQVHKALPQDSQVHFPVPQLQAVRGEDFGVPEEDNQRHRGIEQKESNSSQLLQVLELGG